MKIAISARQTGKTRAFDMTARGLKPAALLAAQREHGDRLRYIAGCRCDACRRANSAYESARQKARKAGDWNGNVSAEKARQHMAFLSKCGVGRRAVAAASDVGDTILSAIIAGRKTQIRARTEKAILAVTQEAASDRALIPAKKTWKLLNRLLKDGYTKSELAAHLGYKTRALQINKDVVTVRNAYLVERMYDQLQCVCAKRTNKLLQELRSEGYSSKQIEQLLADLAHAAGVPLSYLQERNGRIPLKTANLVERLYEQLTS